MMDCDFDYLKREQLKLHGKLHAEAWQHRMRGELDSMKEKQREAKRALYTSRSYDYLKRISHLFTILFFIFSLPHAMAQ